MVCAYGPTAPDGYGICYNPQQQQIMFTITSSKKCHTTDSEKFGTLLFEALQEMNDVINTHRSLTTTKL